jgi:hypothetical protein
MAHALGLVFTAGLNSAAGRQPAPRPGTRTPAGKLDADWTGLAATMIDPDTV